jgi:hypothetical protein
MMGAIDAWLIPLVKRIFSRQKIKDEDFQTKGWEFAMLCGRCVTPPVSERAGLKRLN